MTEAATHLIEEFKALPEPERQEVFAALLATALASPYETTDESLVSAAEEVFLELDQRESR